ncbi:hypothetical protein EV653_4322 [Kribbella pratensis]|uniref:Uncharacterized protein n=1 Tax=Kribbella pratensis TaxID=2512112 RepID=A0A4R8C9V8_9ACTN|nr:hypothetical protein EV653_4322 [Kribbella pratensis]
MGKRADKRRQRAAQQWLERQVQRDRRTVARIDATGGPRLTEASDYYTAKRHIREHDHPELRDDSPDIAWDHTPECHCHCDSHIDLPFR